MTAKEEQDHLLDCLARYLLALPRDRAVETWRHWQDQGSRARKSPQFLADMRQRIDRQRAAQT